MTSVEAELAQASRRAEQEAIAAIRAPSAAASLAHEALSLLHVARVRKLLRARTTRYPDAVACSEDLDMLAV